MPRACVWTTAAPAAVLAALVLCAAPAAGQVELPRTDAVHPITVSAERGSRWTEGAYEVWVLEGGVRIGQGPSVAQSREAVVWIARNSPAEDGRSRLIAYLEGDMRADVRGDGARARTDGAAWLGRWVTDANVYVHVRRADGEPGEMPAIYGRAAARRREELDGAVEQAQFVQPSPGGPAGTRRIRVFSRSAVRIRAQWFPDPQTNQGVAVIDAGVTVVIENVRKYGTLDISADRMVIWTAADQEPGLAGEAVQDERTPLEIYMEGNVVFRQGQRVIYADRVYYNVNRETGTVLGADVLTPAPKYQGLLRLRSEVLQQTGPGRFFAHDTFVTSSRLSKPKYRLQASEILFEDLQQPVIDPATGEPYVDPRTGEPAVDHQQSVTSRHNFLFFDDVPLFYWPWMAADVSDPTLYIRRARYKNDKMFGNQVLTDWNVYQLLGVRRKPEGTNWDASIDYLAKRGLGHGTDFTYRRGSFLGIDGPVSGLFDYWGIKDHGEDRLAGRGLVPPETDYRYRLFWQHRQKLAGDFTFSAEAGWISDRNFLEQYYRQEWETFKDLSTGAELKHVRDNVSWSLSADVRLNDFFAQTEWLPRADHFWLGQPLAESLTWFAHSSAGYARFRTGTAPTFFRDERLFTYLPWESPAAPGDPGVPLSADGERLVTRQEIDWPLQLGPVKVVPYALGELAHWGEDREGDDLQRAYWQAGVRASVPFWNVFPDVESHLWNVHGLAHKVVFDAEFAFTEANRNLEDLPLYDPLDDDSVEAFRRRFAVRTFGQTPGTVADIPLQFDERFYALRSGMAGWVTAPSTEIADDLMALRLGMRHRWQTKRGLPGQRRIVDWIVFDTNAVVFPDPDRDNFGAAVGLVDYDFRWHVGDRLTLVSSGMFDFFHDGAQVITVGGHIQRPPRGRLYLGLRLLEGPFRSHVVLSSFSYQMSPKWIGTASASVDLTGENIGQSLSVTRIGESLLVKFGVSLDAVRGDTGVFFAIEPRFVPKSRVTGAAGQQIETAGLHGLE